MTNMKNQLSFQYLRLALNIALSAADPADKTNLPHFIQE